MTAPEPQQGLTKEEVDLLVRLVREPETRQRLLRLLQETYLNPVFWQRGAEAVKRTYLNPELWRATGEAVRRTYLDPELWRATGEAVKQTYLNPEFWRASGEAFQQTYLNPELWQRAAETIAQSYSGDSLLTEASGVAEALGNAFGAQAEAADLLDSAQAFERDIEASETQEPQPTGGAAPLWWWLATRKEQAQLALLLASLTIIDKLGRFVEDLTGADVPDELRSATEVVFAVAVFLLMYLDHKTRSDEER